MNLKNKNYPNDVHREKRWGGERLGDPWHWCSEPQRGERQEAKESIWITNGWPFSTYVKKYDSTYSRNSKNSAQKKQRNSCHGHHVKWWKPVRTTLEWKRTTAKRKKDPRYSQSKGWEHTSRRQRVTPLNYWKGKTLSPRVLLPIETSFKMKAKKTFSEKYNQRISHL